MTHKYLNYHLRRLKTVRRILGEKTSASLVQTSRLSSSVDSTIAITYWPGCRSRASCHCNECKMPPPGWSVLLVRVTTWHRRCVTYTGCSMSSASFSNCVRWCTSLLRDMVLNICKNLSLWHLTLLLVPDSALQAADVLRRQRLVWRLVNGVSRLQVRWNSLPASLQDIRDHRAFKWNLKTELFNHVFMT